MPRVRLPDGKTVDFPDGTSPQDMQSAIEAHLASNPPPVAGAGPLGLPQPKSPTVDMQPSSSLVPAALTAGDLAAGALKGAGRTANNIGKIIEPDALLKAVGVTPPTRSQPPILTPTNTAQKIGGGIEHAGEFLIPGPAEEALALKAAPYAGKALPAIKMGLAALGSGAVNKVQGGSFGAGALAGGIGSGVAQGMKAVAPTIAESALGIRKIDRAYKSRTPGMAALEDTTGLTPGAVEESGQAVLNDLNPQLKTMMRTSAVAPVDIGKPLSVITDAQNAAIAKNAQGSFNQLNPMANHLTANFATGQRFGQFVPAEDALNLKRGFGDEFVHNWNPETMKGTKSVAARAYGSLAEGIHSSVPGSEELDNRISSLIPVVNRAESIGRNAPTTQQLFHRLAVPTGAMAAPIGMGAYGYEKGGATGAAKGFAEGMAIPLLAASPTGQMALARSLNSEAMRRLVFPLLSGGVLQATRSPNDDPSK